LRARRRAAKIGLAMRPETMPRTPVSAAGGGVIERIIKYAIF
jgi:hypothetical protein